jgi:hypothetical protein
MVSRLLSLSRYRSAGRVLAVASVVALVSLGVVVSGVQRDLPGASVAPPPADSPAPLSADAQLSPHLIIEFLSSDSAQFNFIRESIAPHLLAGDFIDIYDYSSCCGINPTLVGQEAADLRAAAPSGVTIVAHTGLVDNVQQMAAAKPTDVAALAATYEPEGATEPGSYNFSELMSYFSSVNQIDQGSGLTSVAYPTGHPLLAQGLQSYGWNYGDIARETDLVWVETQEWAMDAVNDSSVWTSAVAKLISQFNDAGEPLSKLAVQVSIGNNLHGTGTDPAVALQAINTAVAMGIQNIYIWTAEGDESGLGTLFSSLHHTTTEHSVTFTEAGLPSGTPWSVTFDGSNGSSDSTSIAFDAPSGDYGFIVLSPAATSDGSRYVATPSTGSVDVTSTNLTKSIAYDQQYYLHTVAVPASEGSVSPASGWVPADHLLSLVATPSPADRFSSWTGQGVGSYTGTSDPVEITPGGPVNETAEFVPATGDLVSVVFNETGLPPGDAWNVTLNGAWEESTNSTIDYRAVANSSYPYVIGSPDPGLHPGTRYVMNSAVGNLVVGDTSVEEAVSFATQYNLSAAVSPTGSGEASPSGGWYAPNSEVTLSEVPSIGFDFVGWVGGGKGNYTGTDPSPSLIVKGPIRERAEFYSPLGSSLLSLRAAGLPPGTSWSAYVGGSDWTTNLSSILVPLGYGSVGYAVESPIRVASAVEYVALTSSGTVDLTGGSVGVTVSYVPEAFLVATSTGVGTAAMAPATDGWYLFGTTVVFNATAPSGSVFVGWNGSGIGSYNGTANPVEIKISGPLEEVARFEPTPVKASVGAGPGSGGTGAGTDGWVTPVILVLVALGTVVAMNAAVRMRIRSRRRRARN